MKKKKNAISLLVCLQLGAEIKTARCNSWLRHRVHSISQLQIFGSGVSVCVCVLQRGNSVFSPLPDSTRDKLYTLCTPASESSLCVYVQHSDMQALSHTAFLSCILSRTCSLTRVYRDLSFHIHTHTHTVLPSNDSKQDSWSKVAVSLLGTDNLKP